MKNLEFKSRRNKLAKTIGKSGVAIIRNASITTVIRKKVSETLYGIANLAMRFKVPGFSF